MSSIFNIQVDRTPDTTAYVRIRTNSEDLGSYDQHALLSWLNGALQVFCTWFVLPIVSPQERMVACVCSETLKFLVEVVCTSRL
jgi:hypothetical protein